MRKITAKISSRGLGLSRRGQADYDVGATAAEDMSDRLGTTPAQPMSFVLEESLGHIQ